MATFGKLTDYFSRRKSREELRVGRSSRRSGSYCCTVAEARSLERKLQRPVLAKSRTLPSIPQSPRASRVQRSDLVGGSPPRRKSPPAAAASPEARTPPPPAGEPRRSEDDDNMEGQDDPEPGGAGPRSQSPFSHLRARAAHLRKSISADNHLDVNGDDGPGTAAEDKPARGSKAKLKRKFSLGSVDRKENAHKKSESGISKFTHRLSLKERPAKAERTASEGAHSYRRRSLSVDWADSSKMTQRQQPTPARKSAGPSSPSAARRLYRNLSGKFRVSTNPSSAATSEDGVPSEQEGDEERLRKSTVGNEALFEAVERQQSDLVRLLLSRYSSEELDLNTPNSEGLLPLDIAVMTNNVPVAKLLLRAGAKESPHFASPAGRALHLATLAQEAERRVSELRSQARGAGPPGEPEAAERERRRQLKARERRLRLFRRMLTAFRHAKLPDAPGAARLSVGGSSSLTLDFQEPRRVDSAVVTKYKVSWSAAPSFSCVLGEAVLEDTAALRYDITGLASGTRYFVRVSAYNMKGWGPALASTPACAAPSSWRDVDGRAPRQRGLKEVLDRLLAQIKDGHQSCVCHEQCKAPAQGRKHSVSKSLRHLFQPSSKFVKSLKRGLYLASVLYRDDSVLVTPEDQIPMVEVEDSCPGSLMQDFLWFTKVSYLWEEIPWMQRRLDPARAACSCTLQTRLKMLQAAAHLQGALGTRDLGRAYFEPIKDKHGTALLVLLKDMAASPNPDGARWTRLCKVQLQRKSLSSPEEPGALDALLGTLHEKLAYHRRSRKLLAPGLYLGYLKLCASVEQIRALVPQKLPNVLCHAKIRDNHNVSREEWRWLRAFGSSGSPMETEGGAQGGPPPLLRDLRGAIEDLTARVNVRGDQAQGFRIYTQEVLEFADEVSFLLLLPPCDDVCTVPGQNHPYSPRCGFLTLPLQIFELVHFEAYRPALVGQYCRVSALLELESLLSQQALREAFSQDELAAAKRQQRQLQERLRQAEEVWRDARWMAEALQYARDKQPTGGVSVGGLMGSSEEEAPDSAPSPEARRKLSDFAGLSDEEGSSEVFLTTDSDYDSSRAQSPREPDPPGPLPRGGGGGAPRDPAPDVPRAPERRPGRSAGGRERRRRRRRGPPELFDGDFILPSRQIELLRVTEKRQAFCVRTSSLEFPAPASAPRRPRSRRASSPRRPRPSSADDRRPPPPPPARTRSEERLAAPADGSRATLRVYPQYRTGLPEETSVQLCVSPRTSAGEMVRLVVQEMNRASRRTLGGDPGRDAFYGPERMKHFGLVLVAERREKWLRDDFCPLELQNPWLRGAARMKLTAPLEVPASATRIVRPAPPAAAPTSVSSSASDRFEPPAKALRRRSGLGSPA